MLIDDGSIHQNVWNDSYSELCQHYCMTPTWNNPGQSHGNGVVECANGLLRKHMAQQLLLRGHSSFESIEPYREFIDRGAYKLNHCNWLKSVSQRPPEIWLI